jgi:integrase
MGATKRNWTSTDGEKKEAWAATFYDDQGNRCRKSGFRTRRLAEEWEREERDRLKTEALSPRLKSTSMTVAALCQEWLDATGKGLGEREAVGHQSWKDYDLSVRLHITPRIGKQMLASLTAPDIGAFRKQLLEEVSRVKAKRVLKHFRQAVNYAVGEGYLASNPAATVKISDSKRDQKRAVVPSREEMTAILSELERRAQEEQVRADLKEKPWTRFAAMFTLLQGAGLRIGEARGLPWDAVDLDAGTITVKRGADKMGRIGSPKSRAAYRQVVVGERVINSLKTWRAAGYEGGKFNLVFPTRRGGVQSYTNIRRLNWEPVCRQLGLVDAKGSLLYGLHDARHFRVSEKIAVGANLREIMEEIGHASSAMTLDLYGHLFPEDLEKRREQARLIDEKLGHISVTREAKQLI